MSKITKTKITITIDKEIKEELCRLAKDEGLSLSAFTNMILKHVTKKHI